MQRHKWNSGSVCKTCGLCRQIYRVSESPNCTVGTGRPESFQYTYMRFVKGVCVLSTRERPDCDPPVLDPTQALIKETGLKLTQLDAFYNMYRGVDARFHYKRVALNLQTFFDKGLTTSPDPIVSREHHHSQFTPKGKELAIKIAKLSIQPVNDAYARLEANRRYNTRLNKGSQ